MTSAVQTFGLPEGRRRFADCARELISAIVRAADPAPGVRRAWPAHLHGRPCALLATGKASPAMLTGAPRSGIACGLMIARDEDLGEVPLPASIRTIASDHPAPTARSLHASAEVELWLAGLPADLPLVVLLSGGTSALLTSPASGLCLDDLREATDALLRAGVPIDDLNAVRKHTERLKGGRMAAMLRGRGATVLVLSDVLGDPLDRIASGPFWPDPSTYAQALAVIETHAPHCSAVRAHLTRGVRGEIPETPKPGSFTPPPHRIIGSNRDAVDGVCAEAARNGLHVVRQTEPIIGEASEAACAFVRAFRDARASVAGPLALIAGGEATVTVGGASGVGGRNQEFALAAALELADEPEVMVLSVATDGADGPTPAAGAIAWPGVLASALARGVDPAAALRCHDSHQFFTKAGGLVPGAMTRGSNVNDVMIALNLPVRETPVASDL